MIRQVVDRSFKEFGVWPFSLVSASVIPGFLFSIVTLIFPIASLPNQSFEKFFLWFGTTGMVSGLAAIIIWNFLSKLNWPQLVKVPLAVFGAICAGLMLSFPLFLPFELFRVVAIYYGIPSLIGAVTALIPYIYDDYSTQRKSHSDCSNILLENRSDDRKQT